MAETNAERVARQRREHPEYVARSNLLMRARHRAHTRLAEKYPDDFARLYKREIKREIESPRP